MGMQVQTLPPPQILINWKNNIMVTESYKMEIFDISKSKPKPVLEMKEYDIWLGWYHLGQGYHPPSEPKKVGTVRASSFKIACWLYELQGQIDLIEKRMERNDSYIENIHFGKLYYEPKTNSNSWVGKYYETKEEALKSFK